MLGIREVLHVASGKTPIEHGLLGRGQGRVADGAGWGGSDVHAGCDIQEDKNHPCATEADDSQGRGGGFAGHAAYFVPNWNAYRLVCVPM